MDNSAIDHAVETDRARPLLPEEDAIGDPDDQDDDQDDTLPADLWYRSDNRINPLDHRATGSR